MFCDHRRTGEDATGENVISSVVHVMCQCTAQKSFSCRLKTMPYHCGVTVRTEASVVKMFRVHVSHSLLCSTYMESRA